MTRNEGVAGSGHECDSHVYQSLLHAAMTDPSGLADLARQDWLEESGLERCPLVARLRPIDVWSLTIARDGSGSGRGSSIGSGSDLDTGGDGGVGNRTGGATVTTNEKSLLLAIRDNAEDDTPRLAYADWLEEQGDKGAIRYAAFIRGQIGSPDTSIEVVASKKRGVITVRVISGIKGFNPFRQQDLDRFAFVLPHGGTFVISRGFPAACEMSCSQWQTHGTAIFARYPIRLAKIDRARIRDRGGVLELTRIARTALTRFCSRAESIRVAGSFASTSDLVAFLSAAITDTLLTWPDNDKLYLAGLADGTCFPLTTHPLAIDAQKRLYQRLNVSFP